MRRFDDILKQRIKEAFSSYDAGHLAEEGWDAFVRKGRKKRTGIIIPLWARAASVAVLIGGAGYLLYQSVSDRLNEVDKSPATAENVIEAHEENPESLPGEDKAERYHQAPKENCGKTR